MPVSADDPRPSYLQVAEDLEASIQEGTLSPGARLPSGRELADKYGVALMTVQKALAKLRDAGVLVTARGRGTFVASDGQPAASTSPEYAEISRQLGELRALLQETATHLDTRLAALETAAGITDDGPR